MNVACIAHGCNPMVVILIIIFVIIIIALPLLLFFVGNKGTCSDLEHFASKPEWDLRWGELKRINGKLYKDFFNERSNHLPIINKPGKIMISVASYRDDQCSSTLKNLINNADNPEMLVIYICQQNSTFERDCMFSLTDEEKKVAHIERLSHIKARGPTWARWRIQQKWSGEEYFLQIDAHTRMVKGWDTILKNQLSRCPSPKSCLTQYPLEYDIVEEKDRNNQESERWQVDKKRGGLYVQKFSNPDGFYRIQSDFTNENRSAPYRATCWAAGFSFSKSEFIQDAGYDPNTPFLFFGEEMDIAARAWTHGWDFYSPSETVVFHSYKRDHRNTFWEKPNQRPLEILSRFRIYVRLGYISPQEIPEEYKFILNDIDKYPVGRERSLEEWQTEAHISIKNEELTI